MLNFEIHVPQLSLLNIIYKKTYVQRNGCHTELCFETSFIQIIATVKYTLLRVFFKTRYILPEVRI
jgi:hypothetical protein